MQTCEILFIASDFEMDPNWTKNQSHISSFDKSVYEISILYISASLSYSKEIMHL